MAVPATVGFGYRSGPPEMGEKSRLRHDGFAVRFPATVALPPVRWSL